MSKSNTQKKAEKQDMPDKPYDAGWKGLLDLCAQDVLDWIVGDVAFQGRRSEEFQSEKVQADVFLEVGYQDDGGKKAVNNEEDEHDNRVIIHLEAQSTPDPTMAERLLKYNVLARDRYHCPVESYVVYLKKGGKRPASPLKCVSRGREMFSFHYTDIELPNYTAEALFATGIKGVLPLIPFTMDGARREVIEQIIERLLPARDPINKQLLALTNLFAALAFGDDDQTNREWLKRRFAMLQDILQESPVFQEIFAQGEEKGLEKGLEKARQERQESMQGLRRILIMLVTQHFPKLERQTKRQLLLIKQPQTLNDLIMKMMSACTQEEAQDYLLNWDEQDEAEHDVIAQ